MKHTVHFLSILTVCLFISLNLNSQVLNKNNCDRTVLSEKEYEKCLVDSVFNTDIIAVINYISFLKTDLLPRFRQHRKKIIIPTDLSIYLLELKNTYNSILKNNIWNVSNVMDKNQLFIQPKTYLTSLLHFEVFSFYPDIYAVMLNNVPTWNSINSNSKEFKNIDTLLKRIKESIPEDLLITVTTFATEMEKERLKYKEYSVGNFLQGSIDEQSRQFYSIINFLIWNE